MIHENEIIFNQHTIAKAIGIPNVGKDVRCNSKASKLDDIRRFEGNQIYLEPYWFYKKKNSLPLIQGL